MARGSGKDHARVNLDIWGDDDWLDLSPRAQHLYFVLWTSPQLSYCGAGDWHPGKIASRARGWTVEAIQAAAAELSREMFLLIDTDTDEFVLRSWIKHDGLWRTPNMAVSVANARAELASRTLRSVVVFEVMKLRKHHPDSSSWEREAVEKMLSQKAIDPADLEPYNPTPNGSPNPADNPAPNGYDNPTANPYSHPGVNPTANPAPTPAPSPSPSPLGGYVSGERYEATPPDPNDPPTPNQPVETDSEPPTRCTRHRDHDGDPGPCGQCASARKAHERWEVRDRNRRAEAQSAAARNAAELRATHIAACQMCDDRGYLAGRVCDHDPEAAERNRRGAARAREALQEALAAKGGTSS